MNDMTPVIIPKSDQISADDLIAGPMTVTIREVKIAPGTEQPVSIYMEETDRAFRPCKSMSRVLVQGWGPDANKYLGRSLTLYRDPTVKWAGMEVGGIRISHMSDIDGEKLMMLTATKGSRKPHKVLPLVDAPQTKAKGEDLGAWAHKFIAGVGRAPSLDKLNEYAASVEGKLFDLSNAIPEAHEACVSALETKRASFAPADVDATPDFLPRIAAAQDAADLGLIEADYRAVMLDLPKELADQVEAALAARKGEVA